MTSERLLNSGATATGAPVNVTPPRLWQVEIGGCIESTPAVWGGKIWFGTRDGGIHALFPADQVAQPTAVAPEPVVPPAG